MNVDFNFDNFPGWVPDREVKDTAETARIAALPRRLWDDESATVLSGLLTPLLKTPQGTEKLFPVQAQALHDAGVHKGLFASINLGGGKTLISLLCVVVMQLVRPILLVPASIKKKTQREMKEYSYHWRIPVPRIRIESYEGFSRDGMKNLLENYRPDGIICDEVHRLKNPKAAATRRVSRWMGGHPDTKFAAMSGTITKKSIKDYAHIIKWVFPNNPPIPRGYVELEDWCAAIDEKANPMALFLYPGGILRALASPGDVPQTEEEKSPHVAVATARRAFSRRRNETPGVVATTKGFDGCSLYIDHEMNERKGSAESSIETYISKARGGFNPEDWILPDGPAVYSCVRQLALGFYYRYKVKPPEDWKILRQSWFKRVREWIKNPPRGIVLDTKFQVEQAMTLGQLVDEEDLFAKWRAIEPTYDPQTIAVWVDDGAVKQTASWLHGHPKGIAWVEHIAFGNRLSEVSELPFHHNKGLDANGVEIETASGPIIASIKSNATGRNLQKWCDNYLVSPSPNALETEQLIGRTHRTKQEADEVTARYLIGCIEHLDAIDSALSEARYSQDSTGQPQKILHADLTLPSADDIKKLPSRRYQY